MCTSFRFLWISVSLLGASRLSWMKFHINVFKIKICDGVYKTNLIKNIRQINSTKILQWNICIFIKRGHISSQTIFLKLTYVPYEFYLICSTIIWGNLCIKFIIQLYEGAHCIYYVRKIPFLLYRIFPKWTSKDITCL